MLILDRENSIEIKEKEKVCYVSSWSKFMISKMPLRLDDMVVCDFGAGTGVLSTIAALRGAKNVTAIEKDSSFRDLMKQNFKHNLVSCKVHSVASSCEILNLEYFDYIFCNPSCYPSAVGTSNFYHAGETGMDMINEVILFASKTLKINGCLMILVPSLSPVSLMLESLKGLGLYASRDVDSIFVPFRTNISHRLKQWVDNNSKKYNEMCYFERNGELCERVDLYSIRFTKDNKTKCITI